MFWKYLNKHTSYGQYIQAVQYDLDDLKYYQNNKQEDDSANISNKSDMSWTEEDDSIISEPTS